VGALHDCDDDIEALVAVLHGGEVESLCSLPMDGLMCEIAEFGNWSRSISVLILESTKDISLLPDAFPKS
jgi:hypothetical protein